MKTLFLALILLQQTTLADNSLKPKTEAEIALKKILTQYASKQSWSTNDEYIKDTYNKEIFTKEFLNDRIKKESDIKNSKECKEDSDGYSCNWNSDPILCGQDPVLYEQGGGLAEHEKLYEKFFKSSDCKKNDTTCKIKIGSALYEMKKDKNVWKIHRICCGIYESINNKNCFTENCDNTLYKMKKDKELLEIEKINCKILQ